MWTYILLHATLQRMALVININGEICLQSRCVEKFRVYGEGDLIMKKSVILLFLIMLLVIVVGCQGNDEPELNETDSFVEVSTSNDVDTEDEDNDIEAKQLRISMNNTIFNDFGVSRSIIKELILHVERETKQGIYEFFTLINDETDEFIQTVFEADGFYVELYYLDSDGNIEVLKKSGLTFEEVLGMFYDFYGSEENLSEIVSDISPTEESGFDTPEDVIRAYLEGLRDSDLDRMISAFAVESFIENYDFEATLDRLQIYMPGGMEVNMPNANRLVTEMNVEYRRGQVVDMIISQHLLLLLLEMEDMTQRIEDAGLFVNQFTETLNAPNFQSLELIGFVSPELLDEHYGSEMNQNNLALRAELIGASQQVSRVAVFELDGDRFLLFVDVVDYGGNWYIRYFGGNLSSLLGMAPFMQGIVPPPFVHEFIDEIEIQ